MVNNGVIHYDRVDLLEEAVSSLFVPLRVTIPAVSEFDAVVNATTVGPVVVAHIRCGPATVWRDRGAISSSDPHLVKVMLHRSGPVMVAQDGRTSVLSPGELVAYDTARPYRLVCGDTSDLFVLGIPHAAFGGYADSVSRRTALPVSGEAALGRLLGSLLRGGERADEDESGGVPGPARLHLADALTALVLAAFTTAWAGPGAAAEGDGLADRIRADVLGHLDDPELCAEVVARRHRISVRYLHKLFGAWDQTFAAWVRCQRLQRIRRDLLDPAMGDQATAVIAARWGVLDTRHLSRALRSEFGETVRELRREQRDGP